MKEAVIVSAVRTPVGKFQGSLQSFSAPQIGRADGPRSGPPRRARNEGRRRLPRQRSTPGRVHHGLRPPGRAGTESRPPGSHLRRTVARRPARFTINQVCGSGLKAVALAAQAIQTGNAEIVVAGGMESMTNAPYLLPQARAGYRMGNGALVDAMIHDGLWEAYNGFHMGVGAEMIAAKYGITRESRTHFAAESHRRAAAATAQGLFRDEILPVEIPAAKKGAQPRSSTRTKPSGRRPRSRFLPGSSRRFRRTAR
jgi:acetyl-CoA C-acetyltransferase